MHLATLYRTALAVLVLDQVTKWIVVHFLDLKNRGGMTILDPYVNFRMAWNDGINFGIQIGDRWILIALALLICVWVMWWMYRDLPGRWVQMAAGLVIGGAVGNIIDRLIYGAVADFLNMSCCGWENPWSFNVADIAIFFGAVGLIVLTNDSQPTRDSPRRRE